MDGHDVHARDGTHRWWMVQRRDTQDGGSTAVAFAVQHLRSRSEPAGDTLVRPDTRRCRSARIGVCDSTRLGMVRRELLRPREQSIPCDGMDFGRLISGYSENAGTWCSSNHHWATLRADDRFWIQGIPPIMYSCSDFNATRIG